MKHLFLFTLLSFLSFQLTIGQSMWTKTTNKSDRLSDISYANNFVANEVNLTMMKDKLKNAPMEFTGQDGMLFPIPSPSGEIINLRIFESPVMESGLAAKYPHFKTYSGYDENNTRTNVRIDFTSRGMRVYGKSNEGIFYITPLDSNTENTTFLSFSKSDRILPEDFNHKCNVITSEETQQNITEHAVKSRGNVGENLRTFRVAIAATGEYTIQHDNNVEGGLAAIVTSVNRLNQMYENELSVRMLLVDDNDQIIFTDADTDPYTNEDLGDMLDQNITTLNSIIGVNNYDFGHVYGTQGGGLAGLGVVCSNIKAWGATGILPAEGEEFVEEYVAHEMGHQFSANHSWNSCNGLQGNSSNSTAYEPGSGTTIMSYAGLCGPDNVDSESDPYFNHVSILEATNFLNFVNCAVEIPTGNTAPEVTAPDNGKFIPIQTPFMLTAEATDVDGDDLSYCWEQRNLGPTSTLGFPVGNAPSFRSFPPTDEPTRVFPRMIDLILNQPPSEKEVLPTNSRDLDFAITVRDNHPGSGGLAWDYVSFESTANAGPFVLNTPNGDDNIEWESNTMQEVTWDVANTDAAPVNCQSVDILLSYSNGNIFDFLLLEDTPNDGVATVLVPDSVSVKARIMVKAHDNFFFDISNQKFRINQGPEIVSTSEVIARQIDLFPNPVTNNLNINFNSLDGATTMQLLNVQGSVVLDNQVVEMTNGNAQLDVSNFSPGIYFLKMIIDNTVVTKKVLIQR